MATNNSEISGSSVATQQGSVFHARTVKEIDRHADTDTQTQAAGREDNKQTRLRLLMHRLSNIANIALLLKVDGKGLAAINDQTDGFRVLHLIEESRARFCRPIIC